MEDVEAGRNRSPTQRFGTDRRWTVNVPTKKALKIIHVEGIEMAEATLNFDPFRSREREDDFYDNLAEFLPDKVLQSISNELLEQYQANKASRQDWEDAYSTVWSFLV